jgi:hypothetical protein
MTDIADLAETEETPTPDDDPLAPFDDNPLSPPIALISEVWACQEWYVEEYRAVAADTDQHERLMRGHFGSWANLTTSGILGPSGGPTWDSFREYLSNPDLYPGGKEALRADAIHVEAVRRLKVRTAEAVRAAEKALQELRNDDARLRNREVCNFCGRKLPAWRRRSASTAPG